MKKFIIFSLLTSLSAGLVTYFKDQPNGSTKSDTSKSRSAQIEDIIRLKPAKNAQASNERQFSVVEREPQPPAVVAVLPDLPKILPQAPDPPKPILLEQQPRNTLPGKAVKQPAIPVHTVQRETLVAPRKQEKRTPKVPATAPAESSKIEQPRHVIPPTELKTSLADLEQIAKQDPRAAYDLGLRYFRGDGVRQDSYQALQWMRDAAERGDIGAQKAVGRLYMTGLEEMGADFQEAEKWLTIAAGRGDKEATELLLEAADARKNESEYRISTYRNWQSRYRYRLYWRAGSWNYF